MADSDNGNKQKQKFQLILTMNANGDIQVEGSIGNLMLAYAALELAKDALRQHHQEQNAPRVQPATGPLPQSPFGGPRHG